MKQAALAQLALCRQLRIERREGPFVRNDAVVHASDQHVKELQTLHAVHRGQADARAHIFRRVGLEIEVGDTGFLQRRQVVLQELASRARDQADRLESDHLA